MPGRIATLQMQARELGRLRSGTTTVGANGKSRPTRSDTWIMSSHSEDYIRAAAEEWGGTPERWTPMGNGADQWRVITNATALDAILPPGDPLSQANEMWDRGGCQRRCDGITELLSDQPCLCVAQFGDSWHEQGKGTVCAATSRLNVFLPAMLDFGVWRMETHSYYSANEIAATVDVIRSATAGMVPIRLRIEQRTRVAAGQTKQFPVVALELRGATTQQVLSGQISQLQIAGAPASVAAITAAPDSGVASSEAEWAQIAESASTLEELQAIWRGASADGVLTEALQATLTAASARYKAAAPVVAELPDADTMWSRITATVPADWSSTKVESEFSRVVGYSAEKATSAQMQTFLDHLATAWPTPHPIGVTP